LWVAEFRFGKRKGKVIYRVFRTLWQIGICQPTISQLHYLGLNSAEPAFSGMKLQARGSAPGISLFYKIALLIMPNCLLPGKFFNDSLTML